MRADGPLALALGLTLRLMLPAALAGLACACSSGSTGTLSGSSSGASSGAGSSGGSSGGAGSSSGGASTDAAKVCFDTINQYRASIGLPAYARWTSGESCVDGQAKSDSQSGTAHGAFGTCGEFAQNECPGWPGPAATMIPQCLQMMWGEGPGGGHYDNMTSTQYTMAACGFYTLADGSVWATQDFK
jgi:hypothetical protein